MKQITLDKVFLKPKSFMSALLLLSLSLFSMFATAAQPDVDATGGKSQTERSTRDFNHMTTGFPLTGLHVTVECASCHVGGVFKGTPRNCSGCHAQGMRVVATAKSLKHLVTTEPCEVCHTNTVTFFGARYNHGKAVVGQCKTCHNGLVATGKPTSHTTVNKSTKSCDNCHRTYAWLPSSWNHFGNTAKCVTCHVAGGEGAAYVRNPIGGTSPEAFAHRFTAASDCESCHRTYSSWSGALYDHSGTGASPACSTCHDGVTATGIAQKPGHISTAGTAQCTDCHTSKTTWLGALGAKPSNHIPYVPTTTACSSCHIGTTVVTGSALHVYVSTTCKTCHNSSPVYLGKMTRRTLGNHEGSSTAQDCTSCHARQYNIWNNP